MKTEKIFKILDNSEIPFGPTHFNDKSDRPKILFLGTRITEKSINAGYYYLGLTEKENCFWGVISYCFNDQDFLSGKAKTLVSTLNKHNLVVADLIYKCKYTGSKDNETLRGSEEANLEILLSLIKQADLVVLNGGYSSRGTGTLNYFHKFLKGHIDEKSIQNKNHLLEKGNVIIDGKTTFYVSLDSTSGENRKSLEDKKEIWKKNIELYFQK